MQSCSSSTSSSSDNGHCSTNPPDVMFIFKMVLGSVKTSYERRVANIQPNFFFVENGNAVGAARGHCPIKDPSLGVYFESAEEDSIGGGWEVGAGDGSGSVNGGGGSRGSDGTMRSSGNAFCHDLWATMTSNWAQQF